MGGFLQSILLFRGRLSRGAFWLTALALVVGVLATVTFVEEGGELVRSRSDRKSLGLAMLALEGLIFLSMLTTRLRAMGKPAFYGIGLVVLTVGAIAGAASLNLGKQEATVALTVLATSWVLFILWLALKPDRVPVGQAKPSRSKAADTPSVTGKGDGEAPAATASAAPAGHKPVRGLVGVLLSLRGRLRRDQFWLSVFLVFIGGAVTSQNQDTAGTLVGILTLYVALAVYGKRLHDFNRTAWYMIVPIGATVGVHIALMVMLTQLSNRGVAFGGDMRAFHDLIETANILWLGLAALWVLASILIGSIPGTRGDNRFGMDPREQKDVPLAPPGGEKPKSGS